MLVNFMRCNMKIWIKYLINMIIFGVIYTVVDYLFTKNIDLKMVIVASILYTIFYAILDFVYLRK